jgi:hypothetical protein
LRYFDSEAKLIAEDTIFLPEKAKSVRIGADVYNHCKQHAPEGYSYDYLIEIVCHNNENWVLCADNVDSML